MATQDRNSELVELLMPDFQKRNEPNFAWGNTISMFRSLTGLRGFWPMGSVDENGDVFDLSNQARTLTNNNVVTFDYDGLVPYAQFVNASTQFLSRADEAGLDITGTEAEIVNGGITFGGWFFLDNLSTAQAVIGKFNSAGQRSYRLVYLSSSNRFRMTLSSDGTAQSNTDSTVVVVVSQWFFVVGRLQTGSEESIFVNGTQDDLGSGIAGIFNSTASLDIGANNGGVTNLLDGRVSMNFLCAGALSDAIIQTLFQQSRAMYNA